MKNVISQYLSISTCLAAFLGITGYAQAKPLDMLTLSSQCATDHLLDCNVVASAMVKSEYAPSIAVQIQTGYTEEDGIGGGAILYQLMGDDGQLVSEDYKGFHYDLPMISEGEDYTLLHISGQRVGTGIGNADLLFMSTSLDMPWQPVDIESWKDKIGDFLPEGLEIWHGVDYDFGDWAWTEYTARTELWRESDANCCGTGGDAVIHFDVVDGVLTTTSVDYHPLEAPAR